ncbi:MAG: ATP-binding protein [Acholeplasmataceae bacterium]
MIKKHRDVLFTLITILLATALAVAFEGFGLRRENIILIYIAAILVILIETKYLSYGIVTTIIFGLAFNFFFTEPKYTFIIDDVNYIITLTIFFIVMMIMSALTTRLQKEIELSKTNEHRIDLLYQMSQKLLTAHSKEAMVSMEENELSLFLDRQLMFVFKSPQHIQSSTMVDIKLYEKETEYALQNQIICGYNQTKYSHLPFIIFPIRSENIEGYLMVEGKNEPLSKQEKEFIETNISHMVTVLERDEISDQQRHIKIEMEKEKLKNALLRSISHDLRTPLTTLQTGTSFLYDSYDLIEDDVKKSLLLDINKETARMNEFVENLLNMTKIHANQLNIIKRKELIEDVLTEVQQKVKNRLELHHLNIYVNDDIQYIDADAQLLVQVITNLVDNAIRHTAKDSEITIDYDQDDTHIYINVKDNGGGISPDMIHQIFKDYFTFDSKKEDKTRGMGIGLSISKAIIEAHQGRLLVFNNDQKGATFRIVLPKEIEVQDHDE